MAIAAVPVSLLGDTAYPDKHAAGQIRLIRRAVGARSWLICGVIVRRQDQEHCASITRMIRHYVARRAQVTEGHPHNADERTIAITEIPRYGFIMFKDYG